MHGHGYGYPPRPAGRPADGTMVALRVVLIMLTVVSCSFLAWVPMLRLAIVTRKPLDWMLFCATLLANVGLLIFLGVAVPEDDTEMSDATAITFLSWVMLVMGGVIAYYVVAETRYYERFVPHPHPQPHAQSPQVTGYGYPPPAMPNPYATPATPPPAPAPTPAPATPPTPAPAPVTPEPPRRIDQVRAELDELSDILRQNKDPREDGGR
ncbi:hypothetical protein [Streptomyces sp. NPDC000410]|uniref:hypothetical protein n=1 Tax=Streptomyces sp. NPDC000410 TaxID=3154254 RepID=UPI00331A7CC9